MRTTFLSVQRFDPTPSEGRHMVRSSKMCTLSVAALVALTLACGSAHREPRGCQTDAECPSSAYCLTGVCIAGALPQARIRIAGSGPQLVSHRLVRFDGKDSVDPNPQHTVTAYRWAVKPASAASCDPSTARGSDAELTTIFECAGEYEIELTVKNSLGLESTPMTQGVSVSRSTNPPVIDGQTPDLVFEHRCAGSPATCVPVTEMGDGRFALFVTGSDVESSGALAYEWQVEPPPGVDPSTVQFQPDRLSRTPTVRIAGSAIAGDWTFRALVTDGDGLTTPAQVKVTVANQVPTLTSDVTLVAFDHTYADNVFRAQGTLRLTTADADGDPLLMPEVKLVETVKTGCLFAVPSTVVKGSSVEVTLDLTCSRADELIGAVARQLEATVREVNGGSTTLTLPFEVRDRLPTLAALTVSTGHSVKPCPLPRGACFTAAGQVPLLSDPDGDPVSLVAIAAAGLDQAIWSSDVASGGFTLQTSVSAAGSFRRADGTSPVSLLVTVKDPWSSADVRVALQLSNRAPIATVLAAAPLVRYAVNAYVARASVAQFVDQDGDPIDGVAGSGDPACGNFTVTGGVVDATCSRAFDWTTGAFPDLFGFAGAPLSVSVSVSDPWQRSATVFANVTPARPLPPVLLSGGFSPSVACTCKCLSPGDCLGSAPCRTTDFAPAMNSAGLPVSMNVNFPDGTSNRVDCLAGKCSAPVPVKLCQGPTSLIVTLYNGVTTTNPQIVTASLSCSNDPCAGGGGTCRFPPCPLPP
jgi:hypothetical protein